LPKRTNPEFLVILIGRKTFKLHFEEDTSIGGQFGVLAESYPNPFDELLDKLNAATNERFNVEGIPSN